MRPDWRLRARFQAAPAIPGSSGAGGYVCVPLPPVAEQMYADVMGTRHQDAANKRWAAASEDERKAATTAAVAVSTRRRSAGAALLRAAEEHLTAAGAVVLWDDDL